MLNRRLNLKRETLTELTTGELYALRGAGPDTGPNPTPPVLAPRTLDRKDCLGTSFDSLVVCSDRCGMTYGASCHC